MSKIDLKKIKKEYGVDLEAETEGRWFPLSFIDGVEVKVAKTGNPAYNKALKRLYKPYSKQLRKGKDLASAIEERIQTDLLVGTLLKDWKGMPGSNGKDVPFSKEVAQELFTDPELKALREEVLDFSSEFEAFQKEEDEETAKN